MGPNCYSAKIVDGKRCAKRYMNQDVPVFFGAELDYSQEQQSARRVRGKKKD